MDLPTLPPSILQSEGYLQEANRLFFHPLGLALAIRWPEGNDGEPTIFVYDGRDDPEGITFGPGVIDPEKVQRVKDETLLRARARVTVGPVGVQPG